MRLKSGRRRSGRSLSGLHRRDILTEVEPQPKEGEEDERCSGHAEQSNHQRSESGLRLDDLTTASMLATCGVGSCASNAVRACCDSARLVAKGGAVPGGTRHTGWRPGPRWHGDKGGGY